MCTVTFVGSDSGAIITSNRDEHISRGQAIRPQIYYYKNKKLYFPKDARAGGTWFAVDENANVAVLLNGAQQKHLVRNDYVKSRGLILLDLIGDKTPLMFWAMCDLAGVEPFSLVLYLDGLLWQLRWDFYEKETTRLDAAGRYIWSSCTLYDPDVQQQRAIRFSSFLCENGKPDAKSMLLFHQGSDQEDMENGLVISRIDLLATLSITQALITQNKAEVVHRDLIGKQVFTDSFVVI